MFFMEHTDNGRHHSPVEQLREIRRRNGEPIPSEETLEQMDVRVGQLLDEVAAAPEDQRYQQPDPKFEGPIAQEPHTPQHVLDTLND